MYQFKTVSDTNGQINVASLESTKIRAYTENSSGTTLTETNLSPNSVSLYDRTTRTTLTATTLSSTGTLTISNARLTSVTGVTADSTDNSTRLATTAFVKAQTFGTGAVNFETGTVNIGTNMSGTETVNIGTNGKSTNIYGITRTDSIRGLISSNAFNLWGQVEALGSTITIGYGSTIIMDGTTNVGAINGYNTGTNMTIGSNLNSIGSIAIGGSVGSVSLESITTTVKGTTININTTSGTTNIGSTGNNTIVNGYFNANTITSTTSGTLLSIGNESRTSSIYIGGGGLNGTSGSSQGVAIAYGANNAYSYAQLGSDTLAYNYIRGINLEINTNNAGNTNIGWTNGTTNGTTTLYGITKATKINSLTTTVRFDICDDQTDGLISIGDLIGRKGNIYIGNNMGTTGTVGEICIANNARSPINIKIGTVGQTSVTIEGTNIKQKNKMVGGETMEYVIGNATSSLSLSTTFNFKSTNLQTAIPCYTFVSNVASDYINTASDYIYQYCELIVGGGNPGYGAYCTKFMFFLYKTLGGSSQLCIANKTTVLAGAGEVVLSETYTDLNTMTLNILTPINSINGQRFTTTLISYPTSGLWGYTDCTITAV